MCVRECVSVYMCMYVCTQMGGRQKGLQKLIVVLHVHYTPFTHVHQSHDAYM